MTDIQAGDTIIHINGTRATARGGVCLNTCDEPIVPVEYPIQIQGETVLFGMPWNVSWIAGVERDGAEVAQQMSLWE